MPRSNGPGKGTRKVVLAAAMLEAEQGFSPSYQEIGERVGMSIHSVWYHVNIARRAGLVEPNERGRGRHRTVRISHAGLVWVGLERCDRCGQVRTLQQEELQHEPVGA